MRGGQGVATGHAILWCSCCAVSRSHSAQAGAAEAVGHSLVWLLVLRGQYYGLTRLWHEAAPPTIRLRIVGGWSMRNGQEQSTDICARIPRKSQAEMGNHNRIYCPRVSGSASLNESNSAQHL